MPAKDVLETINQIAADEAYKDKVSVLPLMCGTGKSTAISMKIRQVLEANNGEGLLIVTDSRERMDDYMQPAHLPELASYLKQHEKQVVIMDAANLINARIQQQYVPVLIMTTQRYFRLSPEEVEYYLRWKRPCASHASTIEYEECRRPLIIIDEKPNLMETIQITAKEFGDVESALKMSLDHKRELSEERDFCIGWWKDLSDEFDREAKRYDIQYADPGSYKFFWQMPGKRTAEEIARVLDYVTCNSYELDTFVGRNRYINIYTTARAILQAVSEGCIYEHGSGKHYLNQLYVMLDHYENVRDVAAKVIILDGTADLHPDYYSDPCMLMHNADAFTRSLEKMTIHIIDMETGKTALEESPQRLKEAVNAVDEYLDQHFIFPFGPPLFTYKGIVERAFRTQSEYKDYFDTKSFEHFGHIKGRNDFRDEHDILQVGVNRFPPLYYFLYELRDDPFLLHTLQQETETQASQLIDERCSAKDSTSSKVMNNMLLADIEQNLFRGSIRNPADTLEFHFYLFISHTYYSQLISRMQERYIAMGAKITLEQRPSSLSIAKLQRRKNKNELALRFANWHAKLEEGTLYGREIIKDALGITEKQLDKLIWRHEGSIKKWLDQDRLSKGHYIKRA